MGQSTREYANTQMGVSWSGQTLLQNLFVFQLVRCMCVGVKGPTIHPPIHCDLKVTQNSQTYKMQKKGIVGFA